MKKVPSLRDELRSERVRAAPRGIRSILARDRVEGRDRVTIEFYGRQRERERERGRTR